MMSEGFVLVHMHIESEKDNLVERRQKSGRQKWLSMECCWLYNKVTAINKGNVAGCTMEVNR